MTPDNHDLRVREWAGKAARLLGGIHTWRLGAEAQTWLAAILDDLEAAHTAGDTAAVRSAYAELASLSTRAIRADDPFPEPAPPLPRERINRLIDDLLELAGPDSNAPRHDPGGPGRDATPPGSG